ncbi:MAG TPA: response regulator [Pyrinomonadaceae bacterium]|nr:response regulator [Pyrinomonadaceae bacterium]
MTTEQENKILIVDDSRTIRRMIAKSLASIHKTTFEEAENGLEAIERLVLGPVSLMVLDLNMPEMHGIEVLKFVRSRPAYRSMPVVVLTTRGDEVSQADAMAAGASLYLTKPFSPQELESKVRQLLT